MFQIPLGYHPFRPGQRVRSLARPWWGVGVVLRPSLGGVFTVVWEDYSQDGRLVSRGQAEKLQLKEES